MPGLLSLHTLACGEQTPAPGETVETVPAPTEAATSALSPVTYAPELTAPPGPGAATTALPANTPAPGGTNPVSHTCVGNAAARAHADEGRTDPGVDAVDTQGDPDRGTDRTHIVTDQVPSTATATPFPRTATGEHKPEPAEELQNPVYGSRGSGVRGGAQVPGEPGRRLGLPEGDGPVRAGRGRRRYSM